MIKIASYNCNSVRCHSENVRNILNNVDILFLQELQLCKSDLPILNDLNNDFEVSLLFMIEKLKVLSKEDLPGELLFYGGEVSLLLFPL